MSKILVAYASKHNSTAEIAHTIGEILQRSNALHVDIRPVENVEDIAPYDAVILGSAFNVGELQSPATDFLKKYEQELAQRPVWLFFSGPTGDSDPKTMSKGREFLAALQPVAEHIKRRSIVLFHDKFNTTGLSFFEQPVMKMGHAPISKFHDWDIIQAWAAGIAQALGAEATVSQLPLMNEETNTLAESMRGEVINTFNQLLARTARLSQYRSNKSHLWAETDSISETR